MANGAVRAYMGIAGIIFAWRHGPFRQSTTLTV